MEREGMVAGAGNGEIREDGEDKGRIEMMGIGG
jgi:hypothetical protein